MPKTGKLLRAGRIALARWNGSRGCARHCSVRRGGHGFRARCIRNGGHGALWIEQVIFAGTQAETDQRPRIGYGLALPSMIRLITAHGLFAGLVPTAVSLSGQVVLADERFLDGLGPLRINFLLAFGTLLSRGVFSRGGCVCLASRLLRTGRRRRSLGLLVGFRGCRFLRGCIVR